MKFLITWRIVSVDITVEIPSLLPSKDERVDFPVPDVPASNTKIFLFDSMFEYYKINLYLTYKQDPMPHKNLRGTLDVNTGIFQLSIVLICIWKVEQR